MHLSHLGRSLSSLSVVAPFVAFALVGCVDPFVAGNEAPTMEADAGAGGSSAGVAGSGVGAGASSAGQATGAQPGSAGSLPIGVAGSTTIVVVNAGGADPGVEPGVGGEGPVGAGGEPAPQPQSVSELIDDMEGAFPQLPQQGGRNGAWYTTHDATYGQVSPARAMLLQPARGTSRVAAEFAGGGFTDWGAQLGVSLRSPSAGYDASGFCGVRFMVKGSGSGWSLLISDRQSVPDGGVCDPNAWGNEAACYQFVGKPFEAKSEWQEVAVRFDELKLLNHPDRHRTLDSSAIYDILFNFYHHDGSAFQLMVDDLAFMRETAAGCR
jgi:hypothetical protein